MRNAQGLTLAMTLLRRLGVLFCGLAVFSTFATAQNGTQGQDAVYNASNGVVGSSSFVDASMFAQQGVDFCAVINGILRGTITSYPATGAVIDARGLANSTPPTSMTCAANTTPWSTDGNAHILNLPSTILLPAGIIVIPTTWVLPSNTRLIGEGENNPLIAAPGTTIRAVSPNTQLPTMIQFGLSSPICSGSPATCSGISVEKLNLDGQAQSLDGIVNQFSQNNTYVDHVTIYQILGTGLSISNSGSSSATNSGPYTNITFDTGIYPGTTSTVCAQIIGTSGTRGIHGLRCKSETNDAPAGVLLDASSNSIEDVTLVGFYDGILIGANGNAQSNVLLNIIGDTSVQGATPVNAVHISPNNTVGGALKRLLA